MNGAEILSSTQPQTAPEQTEQSGANDPRFALLAKMERKLREKETGYSAKEKEWGEKEKKLSEYEELIKLMDENPIEAIKKRKGWGLQELNEFAVQHTSEEDLDPVANMTKSFQAKMEELKKSLTEEFEGKIKAKEEEYSKKDYDYQINSFKAEVKGFLSGNKDDYELINALTKEDDGADGTELVYDVIYTDVIKRKEEGEEDLTPMTFKEAADKVEAYLDGKMQKYLNLNKVKSKFTPSDKFDLGSLVSQSKPRTLNSEFATQSKSLDQLSPEERKKQAEDLVKSWIR